MHSIRRHSAYSPVYDALVIGFSPFYLRACRDAYNTTFEYCEQVTANGDGVLRECKDSQAGPTDDEALKKDLEFFLFFQENRARYVGFESYMYVCARRHHGVQNSRLSTHKPGN